MKKFFFIAALAAVALASCVKDEDPVKKPETPTEPADVTGLCINEVWPNQKKIEFYNSGKAEIDLTGCTLTKDGDEATKWTVPSAKLAAGGYAVYTFKSTSEADGPSFGCSETKGFKLELFDASGKTIDVLDNTGSALHDFAADVNSTLGRKTDGDSQWVIFSPGTIGDSNAGGTFVQNWPGDVTPPTPAPGVEVLCLNELNGNDKFIEIVNPSAAAVKIEGIKILKDGKLVWTAPAISVEAGKYLLLYSEDVVVEGGAQAGYDATLVFASGLSSKKAVRVQLVQTDGITVIDDFNLATHPTGTTIEGSYGRNADGEWYIQPTATPNAANVDGAEKLVLGE